MTKEKQTDINEVKKEIVLERLRQSPKNVNISFGMSEGKFMNRDELIKNVEEDTNIGNKIVELQLNYLKAFKKGFLIKQ